MPIHDWTRVEAGIFHDFHTTWIGEIRSTLNERLLPSGYYALAEQHAGQYIADVLTLHATPQPEPDLPPLPPETGGTAVAEAPPRAQRKQSIELAPLDLRRTLAIRHVSGHRLIALLEIISPANKDRPDHVRDFANKAADALKRGVHLLLVDLFPPTPHDPHGMHGEILQRRNAELEPYSVPGEEPLTMASYEGRRGADARVEAYLEHLAVGAALPSMPLFLRNERYIPAPLDETYQATYRGMPAFWRDVLEQQAP